MTDYVVGQFISGRAFFAGVALSVLGCFLKNFIHKKWSMSIARIMIVAGAVIVVTSGAPLSFWLYGMFFMLLALAAMDASKLRDGKLTALLSLSLLTAQSLLMVFIEFGYCKTPHIETAKAGSLFVIGDSISMGADAPGKNWPDVLGELARLKVRNLSFGGAKVASAMDHARLVDEDNAIVVLEIGGNDLLSGTRISQFRSSLEQMLNLVSRGHRQVLMIELPLPPLYNRFGMVQRELAKSHGVRLIPKRYLADVITTAGCTVDGLHLSNKGHEILGRTLFEALVSN